MNKQLTYDKLYEPKSPIVELSLYLYSLDHFLFVELNKASREGDMAKIDTLGPDHSFLNTRRRVPSDASGHTLMCGHKLRT